MDYFAEAKTKHQKVLPVTTFKVLLIKALFIITQTIISQDWTMKLFTYSLVRIN